MILNVIYDVAASFTFTGTGYWPKYMKGTQVSEQGAVSLQLAISMKNIQIIQLPIRETECINCIDLSAVGCSGSWVMSDLT